MDINRDSLGLLPWKELRNVPRKLRKIGRVLRHLREAHVDVKDRIILKRFWIDVYRKSGECQQNKVDEVVENYRI